MKAFFYLLVFSCMYGCGGGGNSQAPTEQVNSDLVLATKLYDGTQRVPAGFFVEERPNVQGTVYTRHIGTSVDSSTDAIALSETQAMFRGQYSDLVDTSDTFRYFEIVRAPRIEPLSIIRHRVFKRSYDPSTDPKYLEYIWQFSPFNNANFVVVGSYPGKLQIAELIPAACSTVRIFNWNGESVEDVREFHVANNPVRFCNGN